MKNNQKSSKKQTTTKNNKSQKPTKNKFLLFMQNLKNKKWFRIFKISLIAIGLSLLVALLAFVGWVLFNIFSEADQKDVTDIAASEDDGLTKAAETGENVEKFFEVNNGDSVIRKEGFYTFLVIGRDKVGLNTDTMIIASLDTKNNKAATVQIPRDSYVEDGSGYAGKINAVYASGYTTARSELNSLKSASSGKTDAELEALCKDTKSNISLDDLKGFISGKTDKYDLYEKYGMQKLQQVINRTFGIYFDYYVIVSTDAFVKIVDAVGGVDLYVQEDMHYDDPTQDLHIHINKGNQHLDGKKAEGFVRFRSGYVQADIARMDAQKIFMTAFFKKLLSFSSVTRVGDIVGAVFDSMDTDITLDNALGFVRPALNVDMSSIKMLNMQGEWTGTRYVLNETANLKIVNENFNIFSHDLKLDALNSAKPAGYVPGNRTEADTDGFTMEGVDKEQPHLSFIPSTPSKPNPAAPSVPDEKTDTPESNDKPEVNDTPEADDNPAPKDEPTEDEPAKDNKPEADDKSEPKDEPAKDNKPEADDKSEPKDEPAKDDNPGEDDEPIKEENDTPEASDPPETTEEPAETETPAAAEQPEEQQPEAA